MKLKVLVAAAALLALPGSAVAQALMPASGSNSASASSWVAGAQAGYNWQLGSIVYGFEADISATHLQSGMNTVLQGAIVPPPTANATANVDWYGTVRGRLGWAAGPVLFYGTGGLAYGQVDLNSSISGIGLTLSSQTSSDKTGWVVGGGIEYMWRPNVILSVGYQYVDLGTISLAASAGALPPTLSQSASVHAQFQVVTAGVNWRFSPTDATSHGAWEGWYAGGRAGGAWGDNASANYSAVAPSDARLKRDITLVARLDDGLGLYRYRYLWSDTVYVGVMAQEVALLHPDAVVRDAMDDYLRVDYGRLSLKLMTLPQWEAVSKGERL
jgi:outer membrane immunogenic protein